MITSVVFSVVKFQNSEGQDVQEIRFSNYTSPANEIKINYPSDWLKKDTGLPASGQGPENKTIIAFSPPEGGVIFRVSVDRLPSASTLQDVSEEELKGISLIAKSLQNVTVEKSGQTSLSNNTAYEILYSYNQEFPTGSMLVKAMVVVTVVNNTKFALSYFGNADSFNSKKKLADSMLDSLQIVKTT
jgi:hypothetical protein